MFNIQLDFQYYNVDITCIRQAESLPYFITWSDKPSAAINSVARNIPLDE
jgi:hypothetical protein